MSDMTHPREESAPDDIQLDADFPFDEHTPHATDFDITDVQQWLDLCA
jgi:hypothetical protein